MTATNWSSWQKSDVSTTSSSVPFAVMYARIDAGSVTRTSTPMKRMSQFSVTSLKVSASPSVRSSLGTNIAVW